MKAQSTFFGLGNADCTLIKTSSKTILWDYANMRTDEPDDKRCDLPKELDSRVIGDYDVVCFTHLDEDHIKGFSDYFYLDHAKKYQSGNRKKMKELWVPAAVILDGESKNDYDSILKAEARFRLKNKAGIRIFSKPDELKTWLERNEINFEEVKHLIVDAGTKVPGWSKEKDDVEFFVHSPFKSHIDNATVIDRNQAGIIVTITFGNAKNTKLLMGADGDADTLKYIVQIARLKKHEEELFWDIVHLPHHCSYTALNSDKGSKKTIPYAEIKSLYEDYGRENCLIISPSDVVPAGETTPPPHIQAFSYYNEDVAKKKAGIIKVTMEHPSKVNPMPIVVEIRDEGHSIATKVLSDLERFNAATVTASKSASSGNYGSI